LVASQLDSLQDAHVEVDGGTRASVLFKLLIIFK
jgi:hypothetical protein